MKSPHEGHRERLKKRFLENGLDSFEPHNILELLLFYSIPRKDTNEIAHDLLDKFGSLSAVFNADIDELVKIDGVKENTATFIKLIPQLLRQYELDLAKNVTTYDTVDKIGRFFKSLYIGETREAVYIMLLNNRFEKLAVKKLHEGSVNSTQISVRKIVEEVTRCNASMVVLAHNHPSGFKTPSYEDIDTTSMLSSTLEKIDILLLEHFLIADETYTPIIRNTFSNSIVSDVQRDFYQKSYE